jgi:hypothetical protein
MCFNAGLLFKKTHKKLNILAGTIPQKGVYQFLNWYNKWMQNRAQVEAAANMAPERLREMRNEGRCAKE